MQFLYPLTVLYISLFAFDVFGKLPIASDHMKSFGDQYGIQILPISAGTFHSNGLYLFFTLPISHLKQVLVENTKFSDVFFPVDQQQPNAIGYLHQPRQHVD